jgi:hypothetical protein
MKTAASVLLAAAHFRYRDGVSEDVISVDAETNQLIDLGCTFLVINANTHVADQPTVENGATMNHRPMRNKVERLTNLTPASHVSLSDSQWVK